MYFLDDDILHCLLCVLSFYPSPFEDPSQAFIPMYPFFIWCLYDAGKCITRATGENLDILVLKWHSLRLLPFQYPKKSRLSGTIPSNGSRNGFSRIKMITFRAIYTTVWRRSDVEINLGDTAYINLRVWPEEIQEISYLSYIYLGSSVCLSSCHIPVVLSYSCRSCGTLSYSLCFSNQTDQGDETEGFEREGGVNRLFIV